VTTTALKQGKADPADVDEVIQWMSRLNRDAARLALEFDMHGGTDVTGFSLLGHGMEMADASAVRLIIHFDQIPFVSCARKYAEMWTFPGGTSDNRAHFGPRAAFAEGISEMEQMLLFDAQTSGGLLLAVPEEKLVSFIARANENQQSAWVIGEAISGAGISIEK
jgi:selenide,water dikinase